MTMTQDATRWTIHDYIGSSAINKWAKKLWSYGCPLSIWNNLHIKYNVKPKSSQKQSSKWVSAVNSREIQWINQISWKYEDYPWPVMDLCTWKNLWVKNYETLDWVAVNVSPTVLTVKPRARTTWRHGWHPWRRFSWWACVRGRWLVPRQSRSNNPLCVARK